MSKRELLGLGALLFPAAYVSFIDHIGKELNRAAAANPNPGTLLEGSFETATDEAILA